MKASLITLALLAFLIPAPSFAKKAESKSPPAKKLLNTDFDYATDQLLRNFGASALNGDRLPRDPADPRSPQSMPVTQSGQNTANPPTIPLFK